MTQGIDPSESGGRTDQDAASPERSQPERLPVSLLPLWFLVALGLVVLYGVLSK